jgi:hypothetical protein
MKIIKFNNRRYAEPPIGRPIPPPKFDKGDTFKKYEIPQFRLDDELRPKGNRQPREEANILGRMKYILQLNGFRGDRG